MLLTIAGAAGKDKIDPSYNVSEISRSAIPVVDLLDIN